MGCLTTEKYNRGYMIKFIVGIFMWLIPILDLSNTALAILHCKRQHFIAAIENKLTYMFNKTYSNN